MSQSLQLVSLGNYKLDGVRLGKGSFASVELARHVLIKMPVALKIVSKKDIKDPYVRDNFHREAKILSKFSHPNIVKLIEICSTNDIYCLVLEYVPGARTLLEVVKVKINIRTILI